MSGKLITKIIESAEMIFNEREINLSKSDNIETFVDGLDRLFNDLKKEIEEAHKESYVTNKFEDKVSRFARECAYYIVECEEEFFKISKEYIIKLFKHRHLGYAFYDFYSETQTFLDNQNEYASILYCSMLEYLSKYSGNFSDNEEAIEKICKYYKYGRYLNKNDRKNLVSALYKNCIFAGDSTDSGFAFNGIRKIKDGFSEIPEDIIIRVIEKYQYSRVVNDKVCRKQIYTMIYSGKFSDEMKAKLKYFYIDIVMIMDQVSIVFFRAFKEKYNLSPISGGMKKICKNTILFETNDKKQSFAWKNLRNNKGKKLLHNNKTLLEIKLVNENIEIKLSSNTQKIKIDNNVNDYILNEYISDSFYNELEKLLNTSKDEINYKKIIFSHIWINGYNKIENQQLSFDNKFKVELNENRIEIKNQEANIISENFFDESIYSISAIVGKNGAGKTSIIKFLRDIFFKLLEEIDNGDRLIKDGIIEENNIINEKYLVIFHINSQAYFITNSIEIINNSNGKILPYERQPLKRNSEKSKLIYFSNMIDPDVTKLHPIINDEKGNILMQGITFNSFVDYSEDRSFIERSNEYSKYYNDLKDKSAPSGSRNIYNNRDFWYQMAFLDVYEDGELSKLLGENFKIEDLECKSYNKEFNKKIKDIFLNKDRDLMDNILQLEKKNLIYLIFKLENLSAGQYAKLSFLSKLHWCLDGFNKYHKKIEDIIGKNVFDINDTILNNSSAIIFIDEGEIFYHPEWQREYVKILIKFINDYGQDKNITLQIILTSNSPFIISDIPSQNIMFIDDSAKKEEILTFGANIHTMLKDSFFLTSTIGEFAKDKINKIFDKLKDIEEFKNKSKYFNEKDEIKDTINMIGDELIKNKLLKLYYKCFNNVNDELSNIQNKLFNIIDNTEMDFINTNNLDSLKLLVNKINNKLIIEGDEKIDKNR